MDKLAIISGAGGGLGRALAIEMTKAGCTVVGLGRREEALAETGSLAGERFVPVTCDVADPAQVAQAFARVDAIGPLSILINNAAVYPRRDILDETPASFAQTMDINLGGLVTCTQEALARFVTTGSGRIMNVATFADVAPIAAASAYSTSKGAARVFTKCLIADLADRFPDIVINDWMPGALNTAMGIPEGLSPEVAAKSGAVMAMWHDPSLTGTTWEVDTEIPAPRGLKDRLKDKLLFRKAVIRRLDPAT